MLVGVGAVRHMAELRRRTGGLPSRPQAAGVEHPDRGQAARDETGFAAELEADEPWRSTEHGRALGLPLRIRNTGRRYLTGGPFAHGVVTIGPYLAPAGRKRVGELAQAPLPRAVGPGEELQSRSASPTTWPPGATRSRSTSSARGSPGSATSGRSRSSHRSRASARCASSSTSAAQRAADRDRQLHPRDGRRGSPRRPATSTSSSRSGPRGRVARDASADGAAGLAVEQRIVVVPPTSHAWRTAWSRLGWPRVERFAGGSTSSTSPTGCTRRSGGGLRATTIHDLVPLRFPDWVDARDAAHARAQVPQRRADLRPDLRQLEFTARTWWSCSAFPTERIASPIPGVDRALLARGRGGRPRRPLRAGGRDAGAAEEPARLVPPFALLRERSPRADARARRGSRAGSASRSPPRACGARLRPRRRARASLSRRGGLRVPVAVRGLRDPGRRGDGERDVPAVVSSHPSLDEASGEAALRADPESPEAFAEALEQALAERESVGQGLEHAKRFTWRACGEAHLHGFRRTS